MSSHNDIEASFDMLQSKLGVEFKNRDLFLEAITHRSFLNENPQAGQHNEKLELLGDAVLEIIVTECLFHRYHDDDEVNEGMLVDYRARLVNNHQLSKVGEKIGLGSILRMSKGQAQLESDSKTRKHMLANAFEALIGALYIDQGIGPCRLVVDAFLHVEISKITQDDKGPKTRLQEICQGRFNITPSYEVIEMTGPAHAPHFLMAICLGEEKIAEGEGNSKQEAKMAAASKALEILCES